MSDLRYETWDASRINPVPWNPRAALTPDDPQWHQIAQSLDAFGLVVPLVVNRRTGNLLSGHQRYAVLTHNGETAIPVTVVDVDAADEKTLNLAMNAARGLWDEEALSGVLDHLADAGLAHLTGFSSQELAQLTGALAAAFTPDGPPITGPGGSTDMAIPTFDHNEQTNHDIENTTEMSHIVCPNCGTEQPA